MRILTMSTYSTDVNQMLHDAAACNLPSQPVLSTFVCTIPIQGVSYNHMGDRFTWAFFMYVSNPTGNFAQKLLLHTYSIQLIKVQGYVLNA